MRWLSILVLGLVLGLGPALGAGPAAAQSPEALELAKRYLALSRTGDQLDAANQSGAEQMVQMVRQSGAAMSEATATRLRDLIKEESAKATQAVLDFLARRLATTLTVADLRGIVRAMESDPALIRLAGALVEAMPELTQISTRESLAVMGRAMMRLKQEKPS